MDRNNKSLDNSNILVLAHCSMRNVPTYSLYGEKPLSVLPEELHCESLPSRSRLHNWEIRPHRHEHFLQILYIRGGEGEVLLGTRTVALVAPCVVVVPATHVHGFRFSSDIDGHIVTVVQTGITPAVTSVFAEPLYKKLDVSAGTEQRVADTFEVLVEAFGSHEVWRVAAIRAALTLLLVQIGVAVGQHGMGAPAESRAQRHARRFHELVEQHFREQREIGFYASVLGITPTQLTRVCRAALGLSPLGVIHRRLMTEAERDLAYTSLSIKEIALMLGFADAAYFSRYFARHAGLTPSAYREAAHVRFSTAEAQT